MAQSLAYLDAGVLWALWNELGLRTLFGRVLPPGRQAVSSADVGFALVAQRYVAPGLKLSRRALGADHGAPCAIGLAPGALNNARIHRVLEALDEAREQTARRGATRGGNGLCPGSWASPMPSHEAREWASRWPPGASWEAAGRHSKSS